MKTNFRRITTIIFMFLMVIMMAACSYAGTYEGDKGTVVIKDNNTWTATLHNTNAYGERYTNRLEGRMDGSALMITKGVYQRGNNISGFFGNVYGNEIEADGYKFKKR